MRDEFGLRTKRRSPLRLKCGAMYYTARRKLLWHSGKFRFSNGVSDRPLPCIQYAHSTPLLRQLRDVEMVYQYNKIVNLKLAVPHLDGVVIQPGETLSYWKRIGKPSRRKGYRDGMVLQSGKVTYGCGGGLCQLSNLIFWMTLHTPLEVVERHRHGYDVFPDSNRTQPFGSGATCYYPYGDLMIYNPTQQPWQLRLRVGKDCLEGEWRSTEEPEYHYEIEEREHHIEREWWGGYSRHNRLFKRIFTLEGELVEEFPVVENHAMMMYAPFLESAEK